MTTPSSNKNQEMKISIALATYNGSKYIQEQLNSFLNQTRLPDEVVISDDGSTDTTVNIIKKFKEKAPFKTIILENQKNLGYAGNFNRALCATTGDLVFLSDQDDVWFSNKIEYMENEINKSGNNDYWLFLNDGSLTDGKLKPSGFTKYGQIVSAGMSNKNFVTGCCSVIKKELLNISLPIPPKVKQHDVWIASFADGLERKKIIPEVLQYIRRHDSNVSSFSASTLEKNTHLKILFGKMHNLITKGEKRNFHQKIEEKKCLLERIKQIEENNYLIPSNDLNKFKETQENLISHLQKRHQIHKKYRPIRIFFIIHLLIAGGYKNSNGIVSAVYDLFIK